MLAGYLQEISQGIVTGTVLKDHPDHVLRHNDLV
jgi:hypothetical protein